jgi:hypothetical protein
MRITTVKGPRLFRVHDPTTNTETNVVWLIAGRRFRVFDMGRTWAFEALATTGGGYADKFAAKRALARHLQREHKLLGKVMGLA